METTLRDFAFVLAFAVLAILFALIAVLIPRFIAPRTVGLKTESIYECGMDPIGTARKRFTVWFYLVAMAFLVFDLEAAFLWPWAVAFRELGMFGFVEALVFVAVLLLGLVYLWRRGGLEWE